MVTKTLLTKNTKKIIEKQRVNAKEMMFDFNNTRPSDMETRTKILKELLGSVGKGDLSCNHLHIFAYGCNTHIGKNFYANFNFQVVDDCEVFIGDDVMCGPNVLLCVTGHPLDPEYRLVVLNSPCQFISVTVYGLALV